MKAPQEGPGGGFPFALADAAIIATFEPAVRRFCTSRISNPADAEDAVQETFLRYVTRSRRDITNPEAWLITVARRVCARHHERSPRRRETPLARPVVDLRPGPEISVLRQQWLRQAFSHLRTRDRIVLYELYIRGTRPLELAGQLGISVDHMYLLAHRARQRMQSVMDDMETTLCSAVPILSVPVPVPNTVAQALHGLVVAFLLLATDAATRSRARPRRKTA